LGIWLGRYSCWACCLSAVDSNGAAALTVDSTFQYIAARSAETNVNGIVEATVVDNGVASEEYSEDDELDTSPNFTKLFTHSTPPVPSLLVDAESRSPAMIPSLPLCSVIVSSRPCVSALLL